MACTSIARPGRQPRDPHRSSNLLILDYVKKIALSIRHWPSRFDTWYAYYNDDEDGDDENKSRNPSTVHRSQTFVAPKDRKIERSKAKTCKGGNIGYERSYKRDRERGECCDLWCGICTKMVAWEGIYKGKKDEVL